MKKFTLVVLLVLGLTGCTFLHNRKSDFDACMADVNCKAQAQAWQSRTETASTIVASAVPVPGAAAAPKVLGYLALGIAALIGGHALRKKQPETVTNGA